MSGKMWLWFRDRIIIIGIGFDKNCCSILWWSGMIEDCWSFRR